jgi:hypothetical protein
MESAKQIRTRSNSLSLLSICAALFLCSVLQAQEKCDVEVKLLLSPSQDQAAVAALNLKQGTTGIVYFFDTSALDLLSQGVIVRLRQGVDSDLTVKLRPSDGEKFSASPNDQETFKCEVDFIGDGPNPAYSVKSKYSGNSIPQTGYDISRLLSSTQKNLLKESRATIDWGRVERMVEIRATTWQTKTLPHFNKLTLEQWEWPGARILELSTRVGFSAGPATYTELRDLAKSKQLSLSPDQRSKTSMVLENVTHPSPR